MFVVDQPDLEQGCQMVFLQTKNPNLGIFWKALECFGIFHGFLCFYGLLVYFIASWYILWLFDILFPRFGMLYQYKSGNPVLE
jgi:hypothetical protein